MPLRSTSSRNRGFTLVEMLIAIAILTITFAMGLYLGIDAYRASLSRSDRDVVVSLLESARSRSLANVYQTAWGVCYAAPNYVVFRGTVCTPGAATSELTEASANAVVNGLSTTSPIVFSELAATTTPQTVTIIEQGRTYTITTTYEGAIIW